jgi:hypothetical protein
MTGYATRPRARLLVTLAAQEPGGDEVPVGRLPRKAGAARGTGRRCRDGGTADRYGYAGGRAFLADLQISDQRALALEELRMPALRRTTPESGQHGPAQRRRYRAAQHWRSSVTGPGVRRGVWPGGLLNRTDTGSRP